MARAINFAVRTSAGKVVRGAVAGEGGSEFLQVGSGESVSINLPPSSVLGYERQGSDLVMSLADGRKITLSGYFESNPGEDNKLFLSSNGDVTEVFLTDGGNGAMYANYGPVDTWNKYSNVDDIRFAEDNTLYATDDTVGMAPFAPGLLGGGGGLGKAALGLAGLGLIGGLGGGGGGGGGGGNGGGGTTPTRRPPTVDDPDSTKNISTKTPDQTVKVTGTGEPGETVQVVLGPKTVTTTIKPDGTWETNFTGPNFPGDGTHEAVVTVTPKTGTPDVLDGPEFIIDMTPPDVSATEGVVSVGDVENLAEYQDGVTIKGEGEAGAKILVNVEGKTQETVVRADGTWSVTFTQSQIAGGDYYELPVTITATDAAGNQTTINDKVAIDTVPHPITFNSVTSDNVVNKAESGGEVLVTGTSTAGATLTIKLEGSSNTQTVQVDANGKWTARYPAGTFANGDGERTFTATTVDAAGNPSTATHKMLVDTTTTVKFAAGFQPADNIVNDNIINADEAKDGVTLTGTSEAGTKSVSVLWNGVAMNVDTLNPDGSWSVKFPTSAVQASGTTSATVTSSDAYGNTATDTRDVTVDRDINVTIDPNQVGGDDVINKAEADAGITLKGTAEAGAEVKVEFQGATRTVTASSDGKWSANFSSGEITRGTYENGPNNVVNVTAKDKAGNVASTTHSIKVDTEVNLTAKTDSYNTNKSDKILNDIEAKDGLTVTGTVEAGATVQVQLGNAGPYQATVNGTTWSYTFRPSDIPTGETNAVLRATATDKLGNVSAPYTETIDIDRIVQPFNRTGGTLGGDGTLNAEEVAAGLNLTGKVEPGSTVKVTLENGAVATTSATSDGNWSVRFEANQLPTGVDSDFKINYEATDPAGNTTTSLDGSNGLPESVKIDTVADPAVGAGYLLEGRGAGAGFTGAMLDQVVDNSFSFYRIDHNGIQNALTLKPSNQLLGAAGAEFNGQPIPDGDYLVINNADTAGNNAATLIVTGDGAVDLSNPAFKSFDFAQLDLGFAATNLTIKAQDLIAITGPDKTLTIKAGDLVNGIANDQITLEGGSFAGKGTGEHAGYNLYTLGNSGASVYLDDDITPTLI